LPQRDYHLVNRAARAAVKEAGHIDDSEFLKLLTHIHDEMLEVVKEQHPTHEQFAAWLLGQIEGRLRMRIGTVKT
jgi:hypothetical protein